MDKQLTREEILDKHLSKSDDIWEVSDLKKAMEEYASQYNRVYNQNLERLIRERDRFSQQTAALQARVVELEANQSMLMTLINERHSWRNDEDVMNWHHKANETLKKIWKID